MPVLSLQEIEKHNTRTDLWVIIHGKVYDLTEFLPEHPGGAKIIMKYAGKDATKAFDPIHPKDIIDRLLPPKVCIGEVNTADLENVETVETEEEKRVKLARQNMPSLDEMFNSFDFEAVSRSILTHEAWSYFSSGANDEITMRENHNAFHRIWFRPRVMVDVKHVDVSTTLLGASSKMPLYISATGFSKLGHQEGEIGLAKASASKGVIQMVSTLASCSFDEIVSAAQPGQTQWLQLYVNQNREITKQFLEHAESRGIKGLFITADAPQLGRRERDLRAKLAMQEPDAVDAHINTQADPKEGRITVLNSFIDATLNWDDIAWFKSVTKMPIVIKGVQTAEDAVLAAKYGCQGVVLSNHGGRQLDFAPSGIEILAETMDALKREGIDLSKFEVYVDGGIRRGSDIFKAIALGAKGVGIGRPALYALSGYGQAGVEKLLQLFQDELEMVMRLAGARTIADIKPEMVDIRNIKDHFVSNPRDNLSHYAYEKMIPRGYNSKL
ncbi:hypothetical protein K501DRAFT_261360 [Backusella circina FSU 941]|nr:hypothetical protein K501DRAFT_233870 [Backusella circina FSU 941]KAI8876892.1 hypothetical protein K501DRAFT_261360 [Backusella circina FSU 941]